MLARPSPLLQFDQVGVEQLRWDRTTDELTFYAPLSQVFTCAHNGLHRLEVFLETHGRRNRSHLWLKLYEGDVASVAPTERPRPARVVGPLMAESLLSHGWFAFEFAPLAGSCRKIFTFVLESPDASHGNALSLRAADGETQGLFIREKSGAGALLFRASCCRAPRLLANFNRFRLGSSSAGKTVSHQPIMARVEISRPCNLGCIMCYRTLFPFDPNRDSPGFMTLDAFRSLDPILPSLLQIMAFGLGEPFLNREYLAILRHARQMNPFVHVFTSSNGTHLSDETIQAIVAEGLITDLQISIDGANSETFESIRKNANYKTVKRTLHRVIAERNTRGNRHMVVKAEMLVMKQTASQIFEYVRQMQAMGVDRIVLDSPKGALVKHLRADDPRELDGIYEQVLRSQKFLYGKSSVLDGPLIEELRVWREKSGRGEEPLDPCWDPCAVMENTKPRSLCGVPWESVMLNSDGSMRVCCISGRPMSKGPVENIAATWERGPAYQQLRSELVVGDLHSDCRECLSQNVVSPDLITIQTYLNACLAEGDSAAAFTGLIGSRIERSEIGYASDLSVELEDIELQADGRASQLGNYRLFGWLCGRQGMRNDTILAISVDSVIRSFAATIAMSDGFAKWSTFMEGILLPLSASRIDVLRLSFREGRQFLELLTKCDKSPPPLRPAAMGTVERPPWLGLSEFVPEPTSEAPIHGFVDEVEVGGDAIMFQGWARDAETGTPAIRIVLMIDGKPVHMVRPWLGRPDVAKAYGDREVVYGFIIEIPQTLFSGIARRQVEVIALNERNLSNELVWGERAKARLAYINSADLSSRDR